MQVALTFVCVAGLAALLYAEYRGHARLRIAGKLVASLAFVMLGLEAFASRGPATQKFGLAIFLGLVFGAIGDVALLGHSKRAFLAGLVAFLIGHIGYVVAVAFVEAPQTWIAQAGIYAALPVLVGGVALVVLWPRLGTMKVPVILYVITIVTMVIAALAVGRGTAISEPHRYLFVAGAALFFVSDLSVARNRFVAREFSNLAWGLPAYFGGQLLIAWSLVGLL